MIAAAIDSTLEFLIYLIGGSANPDQVEAHLTLYANDYTKDKHNYLTNLEQDYVIEKAIKLYQE